MNSIEQDRIELVVLKEAADSHFSNKIKTAIKDAVGDRFHCDPRPYSFNIQLTDENGCPVFGHYFTLSLSPFKEKTLRINYGSLGAFDPIKDQNRVLLIQALNEVISNVCLISYIEGLMRAWDEHEEIYVQKICQLKERMLKENQS